MRHYIVPDQFDGGGRACSLDAAQRRLDAAQGPAGLEADGEADWLVA
jgi:hypothetical protein